MSVKNSVLLTTLAAFGTAAVFAGTTFERARAGACWQDGLFIGDGATAAVASAPGELEWIVNRNDVLDSRVASCDYLAHERVMDAVKTNAGHSVAFLARAEGPSIRMPSDMGEKLTLTTSAAILRIRFWPGVGWAMPSVPATRASVDTRTGELVETQRTLRAERSAVSFVERSRDVMAVALKGEGLAAWIELSSPDDVRLRTRAFVWSNETDVVSFTQQLPGGETYAVAMTVRRGVRVAGRTVAATAANGETLFLAVRTTRDAADPRAAAVAAVRGAHRDGLARVRADHRAWWANFWEKGARVRFDDDDGVDTQWNYALYTLASHFGSAPMGGLEGLFYGPLGGLNGGVSYSCYVHDQNVQIPMMPFFPLGHADFIEPFVRTYENALPELLRQTKRIFGDGAEGAYLPLNMNFFGVAHPIADYRYTQCGGAYSGLVLAQAWWYTHDEAVLRRVYPLLKEFIRFYTSTMTRDADGTCHFIWSVPPEIFTGSRDETATVACLKPCLQVAVEAATRFGTDARERVLWQDILAHYPALAKHADGGWWCGPDIPDDHYMYGGHLFYPFFPAESDTDVETAKRTLDYAFRYGVEIAWTTVPPHPAHDWSALYTGMAQTRLYGGERGWRALKDFQAAYAKPNGHFSHNPILVTNMTDDDVRTNLAKAPKLVRRNQEGQLVTWGREGPDDLTRDERAKVVVAPVIEGGASFLLLASEALCQSWSGEIRLFPSVPKDFTGSFENFRVRGGYVVSAAMKKGRVVSRAVRDAQGRPVRVSGDETRLRVEGNGR